jgi:DNA-binding GntR family transcriptional regulator
MLDEQAAVTTSARAARYSLGHSGQLSHKVAAYVREGIMAGEFRPGEYLRTETLAADLDVSATPVREALMMLHSDGSVRWEQRRGFRVVAISDQDVRDLFGVQAFIASDLAARAAVTLADDAFPRLRALQVRLEEAADISDVAVVDRLNHEIHRIINKSSGSERLLGLLVQTVQFVPFRFFGTIEGWSRASAHDHAPIFDALEARDSERARKAMQEHISHIGELLVHHLQSQREEAQTS